MTQRSLNSPLVANPTFIPYYGSTNDKYNRLHWRYEDIES